MPTPSYTLLSILLAKIDHALKIGERVIAKRASAAHVIPWRERTSILYLWYEVHYMKLFNLDKRQRQQINSGVREIELCTART